MFKMLKIMMGNRVRGAPAIAIVGVLSLVVELQKPTQASTGVPNSLHTLNLTMFLLAAEFAEFVKKQLDYLVVCVIFVAFNLIIS